MAISSHVPSAQGFGFNPFQPRSSFRIHDTRQRKTHQVFQDASYNEQLPEGMTVFHPPFGGGFGIDLDHDGKFNQKKDGILAFDFNKDGKLSKDEISRSKKVLNMITDPGHDDGIRTFAPVDNSEMIKLKSQIDINGDGQLSKNELAKANAKIWIDRDGDGFREGDAGEVYSAGDFNPGNDPFREVAQVSKFGATTQNRFGSVRVENFPPRFPQPTYPTYPRQFPPRFPQPNYPQNFLYMFQQLSMMMMGGFGQRF